MIKYDKTKTFVYHLTLISLLYQIVNVFQENEEKKVGKQNIKFNKPKKLRSCKS